MDKEILELLRDMQNNINKDNELKIMFFEKIEDGGYTIRVQKE